MSQNVKKIIERLKKGLSIKTDSALAKHLGVKPNTISAWKSRDSINYDLIFAKCDDLRKDWLLTGEGGMFEVKNGGKPCENHRSTLDQEANNKELIERFNGMDKTKPYYLLAIGRRLAVHQEGIKESDVLLIDPTMQAIENDLIVRSTPEGAEVARYQSQDSNVMGVVVKLIREYPSLDRAK